MSSSIEQKKEKMSNVRALYAEGLSGGRIAKILSIPRMTVYRWIAKFAEENGENMSAKQKNKNRSTVTNADESRMQSLSSHAYPESQPSTSAGSESAAQKIARLEKELREARLRADFYDEMINVAEKKFGIHIRKKAGAKQ